MELDGWNERMERTDGTERMERDGWNGTDGTRRLERDGSNGTHGTNGWDVTDGTERMERDGSNGTDGMLAVQRSELFEMIGAKSMELIRNNRFRGNCRCVRYQPLMYCYFISFFTKIMESQDAPARMRSVEPVNWLSLNQSRRMRQIGKKKLTNRRGGCRTAADRLPQRLRPVTKPGRSSELWVTKRGDERREEHGGGRESGERGREARRSAWISLKGWRSRVDADVLNGRFGVPRSCIVPVLAWFTGRP